MFCNLETAFECVNH